ncbi:uncharacterized protein LOC135809838 [Sycon ciliatum]|uniref:uncharacterized protein LOC135809838 n=1 Tax=Sycon ciliatum TaxID=27933 RepID=UPI0031F659B8
MDRVTLPPIGNPQRKKRVDRKGHRQWKTDPLKLPGIQNGIMTRSMPCTGCTKKTCSCQVAARRRPRYETWHGQKTTQLHNGQQSKTTANDLLASMGVVYGTKCRLKTPAAQPKKTRMHHHRSKPSKGAAAASQPLKLPPIQTNAKVNQDSHVQQTGRPGGLQIMTGSLPDLHHYYSWLNFVADPVQSGPGQFLSGRHPNYSRHGVYNRAKKVHNRYPGHSSRLVHQRRFSSSLSALDGVDTEQAMHEQAMSRIAKHYPSRHGPVVDYSNPLGISSSVLSKADAATRPNSASMDSGMGSSLCSSTGLSLHGGAVYGAAGGGGHRGGGAAMPPAISSTGFSNAASVASSLHGRMTRDSGLGELGVSPTKTCYGQHARTQLPAIPATSYSTNDKLTHRNTVTSIKTTELPAIVRQLNGNGANSRARQAKHSRLKGDFTEFHNWRSPTVINLMPLDADGRRTTMSNLYGNSSSNAHTMHSHVLASAQHYSAAYMLDAPMYMPLETQLLKTYPQGRHEGTLKNPAALPVQQHFDQVSENTRQALTSSLPSIPTANTAAVKPERNVQLDKRGKVDPKPRAERCRSAQGRVRVKARKEASMKKSKSCISVVNMQLGGYGTPLIVSQSGRLPQSTATTVDTELRFVNDVHIRPIDQHHHHHHHHHHPPQHHHQHQQPRKQQHGQKQQHQLKAAPTDALSTVSSHHFLGNIGTDPQVVAARKHHHGKLMHNLNHRAADTSEQHQEQQQENDLPIPFDELPPDLQQLDRDFLVFLLKKAEKLLLQNSNRDRSVALTQNRAAFIDTVKMILQDMVQSAAAPQQTKATKTGAHHLKNEATALSLANIDAALPGQHAPLPDWHWYNRLMDQQRKQQAITTAGAAPTTNHADVPPAEAHDLNSLRVVGNQFGTEVLAKSRAERSRPERRRGKVREAGGDDSYGSGTDYDSDATSVYQGDEGAAERLTNGRRMGETGGDSDHSGSTGEHTIAADVSDNESVVAPAKHNNVRLHLEGRTPPGNSGGLSPMPGDDNIMLTKSLPALDKDINPSELMAKFRSNLADLDAERLQVTGSPASFTMVSRASSANRSRRNSAKALQPKPHKRGVEESNVQDGRYKNNASTAHTEGATHHDSNDSGVSGSDTAQTSHNRAGQRGAHGAHDGDHDSSDSDGTQHGGNMQRHGKDASLQFTTPSSPSSLDSSGTAGHNADRFGNALPHGIAGKSDRTLAGDGKGRAGEGKDGNSEHTGQLNKHSTDSNTEQSGRGGPSSENDTSGKGENTGSERNHGNDFSGSTGADQRHGEQDAVGNGGKLRNNGQYQNGDPHLRKGRFQNGELGDKSLGSDQHPPGNALPDGHGAGTHHDGKGIQEGNAGVGGGGGAAKGNNRRPHTDALYRGGEEARGTDGSGNNRRHGGSDSEDRQLLVSGMGSRASSREQIYRRPSSDCRTASRGSRQRHRHRPADGKVVPVIQVLEEGDEEFVPTGEVDGDNDVTITVSSPEGDQDLSPEENEDKTLLSNPVRDYLAQKSCPNFGAAAASTEKGPRGKESPEQVRQRLIAGAISESKLLDMFGRNRFTRPYTFSYFPLSDQAYQPPP